MTNDPYSGLQVKSIRQLPRYHCVEISSGERMKRRMDKLYVWGLIAMGVFLFVVSF